MDNLNKKSKQEELFEKIKAIEKDRKEAPNENISEQNEITNDRIEETIIEESEANIIDDTVSEVVNEIDEVNEIKMPTIVEETEEWSRKELVDAITKGMEAMKYIFSNFNRWSDIVHESDLAIGDLRHYCEFNEDPDDEMVRKIYELMRMYSLRRREYKDRCEIFRDFTSCQQRAENIYAAINHVGFKNKKVTGERLYAPRILRELFE